MKIALCLSGQPRYLEYGYFFIKKFILDRYSVDTFVHTWFDESYIDSDLLNTHLSRDFKYDSKTIEKIHNFYNPVKIEYEKEKDFDFFSNELFNQSGKEFDFFNDMHYGGLNPISPYSLYYSVKRANQLKIDYEVENNFKYDLAIRTRLDIVIKSFDLDLNTINPDLIYVGGEHHNNGHIGFSNDNFAVSSSFNMDYYSSLFDKLSFYKEQGQGKICFSGEGLLKCHLYDNSTIPQNFCKNNELYLTAWWEFKTNSCGAIHGYESLYQECIDFTKKLFEQNEK